MRTRERHPASLTKMMTLYLLFDAAEERADDHADSAAGVGHASIQAPHQTVSAARLRPSDVDTAIRAIVMLSRQ